MKINYQNILFNLIFTAFIYMIVPIIIAFACPHSKKQSKIIAIINSIIIYISFTILYSIMDINRIANIAPAVLYGTINYYILEKSIFKKHFNENINKSPRVEISILKSDLILILISILILIISSTFIAIRTINTYKKQLLEKDNEIKRLQDELYLYDYNNFMDSILNNNY